MRTKGFRVHAEFAVETFLVRGIAYEYS